MKKDNYNAISIELEEALGMCEISEESIINSSKDDIELVFSELEEASIKNNMSDVMMMACGLESAINKGMARRLIDQIKMTLTLDPDKCLAININDLAYLDSNNISRNVSKVPVNLECVRTWIDKYKFLTLSPEQVENSETRRRELISMLETLQKTRDAAVTSYLGEAVATIMMFVLTVPFNVIVISLAIWDIYTWFQILSWVFAYFDWRKIASADVRDGWINAMIEIVVDLYEHGTGKKIPRASGGPYIVKLEDLNTIFNTLSAMEEKSVKTFDRASRGFYLEYNDKVQLVDMLRAEYKEMRIPKPSDVSSRNLPLMRRLTSAVAKSTDARATDTLDGRYCTSLYNIWVLLGNMCKTSNKQFSTIVKSLYKM